jgi:hypothetical protein
MDCRPSFDDCPALLHASGWLVTGTNGGNRIPSGGVTGAGAWRDAVAQARALGMLGRSLPRGLRR